MMRKQMEEILINLLSCGVFEIIKNFIMKLWQRKQAAGEGKQLFSQPFCQGLAGLRNSSLRYGSRESNPRCMAPVSWSLFNTMLFMGDRAGYDFQGNVKQ